MYMLENDWKAFCLTRAMSFANHSIAEKKYFSLILHHSRQVITSIRHNLENKRHAFCCRSLAWRTCKFVEILYGAYV